MLLCVHRWASERSGLQAPPGFVRRYAHAAGQRRPVGVVKHEERSRGEPRSQCPRSRELPARARPGYYYLSREIGEAG